MNIYYEIYYIVDIVKKNYNIKFISQKDHKDFYMKKQDLIVVCFIKKDVKIEHILKRMI